MIEPTRRGFLSGAGALLCAPAIVRVGSLMPISQAAVFRISNEELVSNLVTHLDIYFGALAIHPEWANYIGEFK